MTLQELHATALPAIGAAFAGGHYVGRIVVDGSVDDDDRVAAAVWGRADGQWHADRVPVAGAAHIYDGMANTLAIAFAGSMLPAKACRWTSAA